MMTIVRPSFFIVPMIDSMISVFSSSMDAVGSSRKRTSGSKTSARAMPSRWVSPLESVRACWPVFRPQSDEIERSLHLPLYRGVIEAPYLQAVSDIFEYRGIEHAGAGKHQGQSALECYVFCERRAVVKIGNLSAVLLFEQRADPEER